MPVYNAELYLSEAIESVLSQDLKEFEFIIINDGSTDKSEDIILQYKDSRIKYIRNEKNLGLIKTLNKGIDLCCGKYIVRMDADDISLPGRFSRQLNFMEEHPEVGVAGTAYYLFNGNSSKLARVYTEHGILTSLLLFNSSLCHPSVIIRKSMITENKLYYNENCRHIEDYDLWIRFAKVSHIANINEGLLKYRYHAGQISIQQNALQKENAAKLREEYLTSLGVQFTQDDLYTHLSVAENRRLTSEEELVAIEKWFIKLSQQNKLPPGTPKEQFEFTLGKMWYDSCGNTSLGLKAYRHFFSSRLSMAFPLSAKQKVKLAVKCLIRSFR